MKLENAPLAIVGRLPSNLSRRMLFFHFHHTFPRVKSPKTFSEKINWRILKDRREIMAWTCDKLAMKDYANSVQGAMDRGIQIPRTLWSGTDVTELESFKLPDHWVLKPNHRSGCVFFGHGQPDISVLRETVRGWLRPAEKIDLHEWAYSQARPLLFAEEFLGEPGLPLPDYKFYVFDGNVAAVEVHTDRFTYHRYRWYSLDWNPLDVRVGRYPLAPTMASPPDNFENMVAIASELGHVFDFMRVDLYSTNDKAFFGELTPYPASGFIRFYPQSFDDELGSKWKLPVL